jgi:L-lactate utilization protein LutC
MKESTLNQEFNFYYSKLTEGQKRSLLTMMKSFLEKTEEKSRRISVTQYNKELAEAEKRIAQGQFITQESLREEAKKW